jgi:prephenate dehydratase
VNPARRRPLRVSFLGPEGTFSEEALFTAVDRSQVDPVPLPTIYDCVIAVEERRVDRAFVPIENSLEGSVSATLDALVFETDDVTITGEFVHPIQHSLIAREQLGLPEIERVVSHPQASGQCARFLRQRLGEAEVVAASSTADAVKIVASSEARWAALGTRLSAELYGCKVLLEGVEDHPENETRFIWLARKDAATAERSSLPKPIDRLGEPVDRLGDRPYSFKTSVVFWGLPDSPGALVEVLRAFADRDVNLSKIESRPLKQGLGRYIFFADLEGADDDPAIEAALDTLRKRVDTVRVLGSYPAASEAGRTADGPPPITG